MTFLAVLAAVLLLGARGDVALADAGKLRPPARTIANTSWTKQLHRWFPKTIRLPHPRKPSAVAVSPENLCKNRELSTQRSEDTSIVVGTVGLGRLPKGVRIADAERNEYRVGMFAYLIPRNGGPIWAGEVTVPDRAKVSVAGAPALPFSATLRKPSGEASLLVIVVGEGLATSEDGPGAPMVLGACVRAL